MSCPVAPVRMLVALPATALLAMALLSGCAIRGDDDQPARRIRAADRPALLMSADFARCVPPGRHLAFQPFQVREPARITHLRTGVEQVDLAQPPAVDTLRLWVSAKPAGQEPTSGTRSWPYGMDETATRQTGWGQSWDPLPLPDEPARYLEPGAYYAFVLLEGRQGGKADIRLGWESRTRADGELRFGRGITFDKSC